MGGRAAAGRRPMKPVRLFRRRRQAPGAESAPEEATVLRDPRLGAKLSGICVVRTDGRVAIARGYETDRELRAALLALRRDGTIPDGGEETSVSLEDIRAAREEAGLDLRRAAGAGDPRLALRTRRLLDEAAAARASDIVFETDAGGCAVSVIVNDRKLPLSAPLTADEGRAIAGFLFHSKEEGSAQTSYQRGSFQGFSVRAGGAVPLPANISGLRCQRGPHEPDGDHLFARLFYRDQISPDTTLADLGFSAEEEAVFAEIRMSLHGGIFLGGSTGDGKSTTLAVNLSLQQQEHQGELNIVTVEDPVEYSIAGAVQIAVPTTGTGDERAEHFRKALMHFCRVHPAAGMVSEIRDADAAREVLQFIDTGHQVWTTIHVHSANGILFRLLDMGVSPAEVCKPGNIQLLMKQTLVPRLCPECSRPEPGDGIEVPPWLAERLRGWPGVRWRNPEGCAACLRTDAGEIARAAWSGYVGQTALAEMIRPDAAYLEFVRARDASGAWEHWVDKLGGVPLGDRIAGMVERGLADPFDAIRKGARLDSRRGLSLIEGGVA